MVGETGFGKSSLLNALLDCKISPTSQSEACTAAVCTFSWNSNNSPAKAFRANINYKTRASVQADVNNLIEELEELEARVADQDGVGDPEFISRQSQAVKELKLLKTWSGLSGADIRELRASEIIQQSNLPFLNHQDEDHRGLEVIEAKSARLFQLAIKPYIDSTSRNSLWPLVESVDIFLKADVLLHGIKLVDLPGTMDSLDSRSGVAKEYLWKLDLRMIVSQACRAADSKSAADSSLLGLDALEMELDGKCRAGCLIFVVTKVDDIDVSDAEQDWPEDKDVQDSVKDISAQVVRLVDIEEEIQQLEEVLDENPPIPKEEEDSGDEEEGEGEGDGDNGPEDSADETICGREVSRKLKNLEKERAKHQSELERLLSLQKGHCIKARNIASVHAITERFREETASFGNGNGNGNGNPNPNPRENQRGNVRVHPTSSMAYHQLKSKALMAGFSDLDSTGIPGLRRGLVLSSLPYREQAATSDIRHQRVLFDALDGWTLDEKSMQLNIPADKRDGIQGCLTKALEELQKVSQTYPPRIAFHVCALREEILTQIS